MADEFAKGFGILVTAGLGWMTLAGWYKTPSFEGQQLSAEPGEAASVYDQIGLFLEPALFWFAILGALTFWIILPALERARESYAERAE